MAVTGFWPVYRNLKATLDYADNPDKTTDPEYLDEDLYAALRYVENDNKTDRQVFVGGINCSRQNAYAEMIAVQQRFGLRGKVVGYHGIQSFREGEVTPEQAFAIGKETARQMWGDRYQVLVTVHAEKLTVLQYALEQYTNWDDKDIPESVIEAFVVKIVASKDGFDWYLRFNGNPDDPLHCTVGGKRKSTATISVAGECSPAVHS